MKTTAMMTLFSVATKQNQPLCSFFCALFSVSMTRRRGPSGVRHKLYKDVLRMRMHAREILRAEAATSDKTCVRTHASDSFTSTWRTSCPQEGNVPYVVEGGFGSFSKNPSEIADTISKWFRDDELLARMSSKAKQASRPMVRLSTTPSVL